MKTKLISSSLLVFFVALSMKGQEALKRTLIDKNTKNPIFGAYVLNNNKQVGLSDNSGEFIINLQQLSTKNDSICFSHISYGMHCFSLDGIKKSSKIEIKNSGFLLEEIVLSSDKEQKKKIKSILSSARKKFKEEYPKSYYWSEINLKQLVSFENVPQNYIEFFGHIFMIDTKIRDPFIRPFIIPNEVRRTEEPKVLQKTLRKRYPHSKFSLQQSAHSLGDGVPFFYRIFEKIHPLGRKSSKYSIHLADEVEIEGKEYYVFEYKRARRFKVQTRLFHTFYGKFWINKKTYSLFKEETSFHFENINNINMSINYVEKENKIYPLQITSNVFRHLNKGLDKNLKNSSIISFTKIDTKERENYWKVNGNGLMFFCEDFKYHKNFWKDFPLEENPFKESLYTIFKDRGQHQTFKDGTASDVYDKKSDVYKYLYKVDLEKWEKIKVILKRDLNLSSK